MSQVQLEAFFLVQNTCTAFPSTLVSMLELSPPLPILLLLHVAGLSGLNTIIVNRYNCWISGSHKPHVTCELQRGNPKVNVWAGLMHDKLIGPFYFLENTVTTSSSPPTKWGATTYLPPCSESPGQKDGWQMDRQKWTNRSAS
jgi:hypothetical protein